MKWIEDERLSQIEHSKLQFMEKLVFELHSLEEEKRLPFLLALATKAKKQNISFSEEEANLMITVIKEYSSDEELAKMDQMLKIFRNRNKTKQGTP